MPFIMIHIDNLTDILELNLFFVDSLLLSD
jgi:hypothetical protein